MKQSRARKSIASSAPPRAGASLDGTAHVGASNVSRDMRMWRPPRRSADAEILPELGTMVGRARDIDRNNGVAHGVVQTIVDNVIGVGLRLAPMPNYRVLGKSKEWADGWSAEVVSLWSSYWGTTAVHAGDTLNGDQIMQQALRAQLLNGDALGLPLWLPNAYDAFATKVQTIEGDRLSNPYGRADTLQLRGGIEFNEYGAPIAYNFRRAHPGDIAVSGVSALAFQWERIPRKTPFGRLRVLHAYDAERSEQSRGKPILAPVLAQFKSLDRYSNAELQAAVVNAMVAGTITTPLGHDDILEMFKNDPKGYQDARAESGVRLEPGALIPLFPGDKLDSFLPARPATAFGAFTTNVLRFIGVAADLPYELVLKDFSKTNYSSARAAMLEAWRSFNRRRDNITSMFCDPIFALWLEEVVNDGRIEAPDFYSSRAAYLRCRWIGPGRGWVDPVKEAQAAAMRLDANISTLEHECAEQGLDWREVLDQREIEVAELKRRGLNAIAPTQKPSVTASDAATGQDPAIETAPDSEDAPATETTTTGE